MSPARIPKRWRISPVTLVGSVLTLLCLTLYLSGPSFVQGVSNLAYDAFLKRTSTPARSGQVAIVDIDEVSLAQYGQWPWPRYRVAEMARRILDAGATVVAFDVVFAEKDRTAPAVVEEDLREFRKKNYQFYVSVDGKPAKQEDLDFDADFAEVVKGGAVVLGCMVQPSDTGVVTVAVQDPCYDANRIVVSGGRDASKFLKQASGIILPIETLNRIGKTAFFNADPDSDNIVRNNPLVWAVGPDRVYPSLGLEALRIHLGIPKIRVECDALGVSEVQLRRPGEKDAQVIPTDRSGAMIVNYRSTVSSTETGFTTSFPTYPAISVLMGSIPPGALAGKIVFVGASAGGLKDTKASPLTQFFSGVEVHATIVDNILTGDILSCPFETILANSVAVTAMGIFLTVFINRGRSWLSFIISLAMILGSIQVSMVLMKHYHIVYLPAWIILSVLIIYPTLTMIKFWQEELQKKRVRDMFGTMVSQSVLHYLESNPDSFSLSGQKADATMFFSDVAGFTTISESLQPEQLSSLLNAYLSPMTHIIMERGGYVDKYEGDLIMAEWGVPYPMKDHALQACHAALEQQEKLAVLRPVLKEQFGHDIHIRIGINSGSVTAGNMGSDRRFQYTVMGDAVNLASRLEPVNKDYGTLIVIGETTRAAVGDAVEVRQLDLMVVKGKSKPVAIYELLAVKGSLSVVRRQVVDLYESALETHWNRKWDEALVLLERAIELDPNDTPSHTLKARIVAYQVTPPPVSWNGEHVRAEKD